MNKRIISLLLCVFLILPLMPMAVHADDSPSSPVILLGSAAVAKGNTVWFGSYYGIEPLKSNWRVLQRDEKNGKALLIMDKLAYFTSFNDNYDDKNVWEGSTAQQWCEEYYDRFWSGGLYAEKKAVLPTTIEETENYTLDDRIYGPASINEEHLFFLSAREAYELFDDDEDRAAITVDDDINCRSWWLRLPFEESAYLAARVEVDGSIGIEDISFPILRARPAFNLDLSVVLFASAAEGGKSSAAEGGALQKIEPGDCSDWKLTILDDARSFTAAADSDAVLTQTVGYTEWSVPISFEYSYTGESDFVSALLCKDGAALYYGQLLTPTASTGTASVPIPAGLEAGSYKLYVFNEMLSGDKLSDFSSAFSEITLTVKAAPATEPAFATTNLVLSGRIGLSFNMDLPGIDGVDYSTSYMTFTIPHGTVTERVDYAASTTKSSGNRAFVAYVNSIQMAEPVTATFHYTQSGIEKTVVKTCSVADYFDSCDSYMSGFDETTQALVKAVADYGHYVQPFLAANRNWTLGTDYATMSKHYTDNYDIAAIKTASAEYKIVSNDQSYGDIAENGITHSLTLDSDTVINVYFKMADGYAGSFSAAVNNGANFECVKLSGGRYCVKIKGIAAHELSNEFTITVTTENGIATVRASALSYVNSALTYYTDDEDAQNAVAAIYAYSKAADAYKAAH